MASKPKKGGDSAADDPIRNHPAWKLLMALYSLVSACRNARVFGEYADEVKERRNWWIEQTNLISRQESERAHKRVLEGTPKHEAYAPVRELMKASQTRPRIALHSERKQAFERVVKNGLSCCEAANEALRAGGAKGLDAALEPGTARRSIELGAKLREAESAFTGLSSILIMPEVLIDEYVQALENLGPWFETSGNELSAVMEQFGLDARKVSDSSAPDAGTHARLRSKPGGYTAKELRDEIETTDMSISESTFRNIRKAAGLGPSEPGKAGQYRTYSNNDIRKLAAAAKQGGFRSGKKIAAAWLALIEP